MTAGVSNASRKVIAITSGVATGGTQEDTPVTVSLLANTNDVDGDALRVAIVSGPATVRGQCRRHVYLSGSRQLQRLWTVSATGSMTARPIRALRPSVSSIAAVNDVPVAADVS